MKKLLIITFGVILLIGIAVSSTQINHSISFDKDKKDVLKNIGITAPVISSCIKMDNYTCKANVYEKGGINKEIRIITKYCETYEIVYSNGGCLNWENETCLEYEIIETQGNCSIWKTLTQTEIETEIKKKLEDLLKSIADIQIKRNNETTLLTDEIKIEIKEIGKIVK